MTRSRLTRAIALALVAAATGKLSDLKEIQGLNDYGPGPRDRNLPPGVVLWESFESMELGWVAPGDIPMINTVDTRGRCASGREARQAGNSYLGSRKTAEEQRTRGHQWFMARPIEASQRAPLKTAGEMAVGFDGFFTTAGDRRLQLLTRKGDVEVLYEPYDMYSPPIVDTGLRIEVIYQDGEYILMVTVCENGRVLMYDIPRSKLMKKTNFQVRITRLSEEEIGERREGDTEVVGRVDVFVDGEPVTSEIPTVSSEGPCWAENTESLEVVMYGEDESSSASIDNIIVATSHEQAEAAREITTNCRVREEKLAAIVESEGEDWIEARDSSQDFFNRAPEPQGAPEEEPDERVKRTLERLAVEVGEEEGGTKDAPDAPPAAGAGAGAEPVEEHDPVDDIPLHTEVPLGDSAEDEL